jgi:ABC-type Zn uptake system ZnuABC Zn-binding protein ZnuA
LHDPEVDLHQPAQVLIRCVALALALAVPGPGLAQQPVRVATTSSDLKSLVQAVGGARVSVESFAAPEQDPHGIELKPAQLARLAVAEMLVRIGLDHEPWLQRAKVGDKTRVLDASKTVRLLQTETPRLRVERKAHVHAFGNTHYWLDPENARPITGAIVTALSGLRPSERTYFDANRRTFLDRLDEKIRAWQKALQPFRGTRVVVMHDSWAYFAERFGLQIVAAVEPSPGVPPSPTELAALFSRMRQAGVRLLIAEPHSNPALVAQVSGRTGARTVTLLPSGQDYMALFDENVARLSRAF